ncbi:hypothetical protein CI238_07231, partial [Colletotrichum incanum]
LYRALRPVALMEASLFRAVATRGDVTNCCLFLIWRQTSGRPAVGDRQRQVSVRTTGDPEMSSWKSDFRGARSKALLAHSLETRRNLSYADYQFALYWLPPLALSAADMNEQENSRRSKRASIRQPDLQCLTDI